MSRFKVLPLQNLFENIFWFNDFELDLTFLQLEDYGFTRHEAVFYRDGWYYDRINNLSWHEWAGYAWTCSDEEQFKYELCQYDAPLLENAEIDAIRTLSTYGNVGGKILRALGMIWVASNEKKMLRNIKLESFHARLKIIGK